MMQHAVPKNSINKLWPELHLQGKINGHTFHRMAGPAKGGGRGSRGRTRRLPPGAIYYHLNGQKENRFYGFVGDTQTEFGGCWWCPQGGGCVSLTYRFNSEVSLRGWWVVVVLEGATERKEGRNLRARTENLFSCDEANKGFLLLGCWPWKLFICHGRHKRRRRELYKER